MVFPIPHTSHPIPFYYKYPPNQKKSIFFKKSSDFIFFWPRSFLILLLQYDFDIGGSEVFDRLLLNKRASEK
jgi:hypothetical protein